MTGPLCKITTTGVKQNFLQMWK